LEKNFAEKCFNKTNFNFLDRPVAVNVGAGGGTVGGVEVTATVAGGGSTKGSTDSVTSEGSTGSSRKQLLS
jgi:hypothetical protein